MPSSEPSYSYSTRQVFCLTTGWTITSNLSLYANYLRDPQNIDLDWLNGLSYAITEHLQINLFLNAFYDDNIRVQITDNKQPNGTRGLGQRLSITQQLLISYARNF